MGDTGAKRTARSDDEEDDEGIEDDEEDSSPDEPVSSANTLTKDDFNNSENEGVQENNSLDAQDTDSKLPFPRATITNLVRKNISKGKQIKGNVKDEMNYWVAKMVERIATKMNNQPYTFVNYDMLRDAVAPYEDLQGINRQREQLIKRINSIKAECDAVISQIDSETKSKLVSLKLEQEELPFPKATITNKLRKFLNQNKTIKGPVKRGLNVWLGTLVGRVSAKMNSYPYPYVDRSMLKEAIEPYEAVGEIELEKERIIQQMQSMKTACDLLVMEIDRKFKI